VDDWITARGRGDARAAATGGAARRSAAGELAGLNEE